MKTPNLQNTMHFQWFLPLSLFIVLSITIIYIASLDHDPLKWLIVSTILSLVIILCYSNQHYLAWSNHHQRLWRAYTQEVDFSKQIMENVSHGLTIADEHGRFVYVNNAYADLLGIPAQDIVGHSVFDYICNEDKDILRQSIDQRQQGKSSTYISRLHKIDGKKVRVLVISTPRTHEGRIVGSVSSIIPIDDDLELNQSKIDSAAIDDSTLQNLHTQSLLNHQLKKRQFH